MNDKEKIGQRLREIRKEKGITTYQLADMTGLKQSNISRIENGRYSTRIDILEKIADALGYEIDFVEKKNIG